jgi:hypothetical protein
VRAPCALLVALASSVACSGETNPVNAPRDASSEVAVDAAPGVSVELGSGGPAWQSLPTDGSGQCEIVHGPQGGYHIFGRARIHGLPPDVYVTYRVLTADGARLLTDDRDRLRRMVGRGLLQTSAGLESTSGELVILMVQGPAEVVGQRFRFEVRVQDANGTAMTSDVREVTIVDNVP